MSTSMRPHGGLRLTTAFAAAVLIASGCGEDTPPAGPTPPQNQAPVAQAGPDQVVNARIEVSLDGTGSTDADGDALTYSWSIASAPAGSTATFSDASAAQTTFVPDVPGVYSVELVVNDGTVDSAADAVAITAEDNTATETIGAGGGTITSLDGALELDVPAGALTGDTEISITSVAATQVPALFEGLSDLVLYDLQPSGLTFASPVNVTLELPGQVTTDEEGVTVAVGHALVFNDDLTEADPLLETTYVATAGDDMLRMTGGIEHFSKLATTTFENPETGRSGLRARIEGPSVVVVGETFSLRTVLQGGDFSPRFAYQENQARAPIEAADFQSDLETTLVDNVTSLAATSQYTCSEVDESAQFGVGIVAEFTDGNSLFMAALPEIELVARFNLSGTLACDPAPAGTFTAVPSERAEQVALVATDEDVYAVAGDLALTLFNVDGDILREVTRPSSPEELRGVVGSTNASGEGPLFGYGSGGVYYQDPNQLDMLMHLNLPENTGSVTDAARIRYALEFAPAVDQTAPTADEAFAFAMFEERNILFVQSDGAGGWEVVPELADAFVQDGVSIFGDDRPLSLWIGPNGFDENNPMLVLTIDDNTFGDLNIVSLENGVAVRTIVPDFTSIIEPRQLRCDDATGICGMSSFRTRSFGGIYTFLWDGQDGVTALSPRLSFAPVGIDVVNTGTSILMAGTDTRRFVDGAYRYDVRVVEYSLTGALQRSVAVRLPEECIDPFHALFRRRVPEFAEVLVSCKGDEQNGGRVIAVPWAWPSG